ncbi:uncharacterized protein LOC144704891 [Wolffia australiana]
MDESRRSSSLRRRSSDRGPSLSLGTVIGVEKLRSNSAGEARATSSAPAAGLTLMDIIRDEDDGRTNWRPFKDRLRNQPNGPEVNRPEVNGPPPGQPRMSLMALLEQTDNQGPRPGAAVSGLLEEGGQPEKAEDDDEEGEHRGEDGGERMYVKCCVCMVRHKGAAFIPCGHTFCRLCSRELWVSRGNCPLCNGFILEILDIF